ncbi:MAG: hypothetical protein V1922_05890 [bacterium]
MIDKIKHFSFVILTLFISFFVSSFIAAEVFIGNSPTIRPHLDSYLAQKMQTLTSPVSNLLASLQGKAPGTMENKTVKQRYEVLQSVPFLNVATGVAAREKYGVAETHYDLNKIKWIEYSYKTRVGTTIKIKIPEGQKLPPPGVL